MIYFRILGSSIYKNLFDGSSLLTTALHPHVDMSQLPQVGAGLMTVESDSDDDG